MNIKNIGKNTIKIGSLILGVGAVAWIGIGNYFVNYALVPGQGAEDRQVEEVDGIAITSANEQIIKENEIAAKAFRDDWLANKAPITQNVSIEAEDGVKLVGHVYLQEKPTDLWMIIVHGYQVDEKHSQIIAPNIYEAGYNVLTMDLRAHGQSEGDYIGMGYLDQFDLRAWVDWLIDKYPDSKIAIHGSSMGGATVLLAAGHALPDNVKVLVADSAYSNIKGIFASELDKRFGLPSFPVLDMAETVLRIRAGYDFSDGDVLEATSNNALPTLFIHGDADDFVPIEMGRDLYNAKPGNDKVWSEFKDAGHVDAKYSEPERYYREVVEFVGKYMQ